MTKRKFATQAPADLLDAVRAIARDEGRQFQSVVEQALRAFVEQHRDARPRPEVLAHLRTSIERNDDLYRRLAE